MIFETIAAIKIANDAISAVKEMVNNVQSIGQMGSQLTKLTDAEDTIKEKADKGDLDAFLALEEIRQAKIDLKNQMVWGGRAGLWDDFQKFQKTRRDLREAQAQREAKAKAQRRRQIRDWVIGTSLALCILSAVGIVVFIFYAISQR